MVEGDAAALVELEALRPVNSAAAKVLTEAGGEQGQLMAVGPLDHPRLETHLALAIVLGIVPMDVLDL